MHKIICILQTIDMFLDSNLRNFHTYSLILTYLYMALNLVIYLRDKSIIIWYTPLPPCIHTCSLPCPAIWRVTVHWNLPINVHMAASDGDTTTTTTTNDTVYNFITVRFISKEQVVWNKNK